MKRLLTLLASLAVLLTLTSILHGQDDIPLVRLPIDPSTIDISGDWSYSTSDHQVSGKCPAGTPMTGILAIAEKENAIDVVVRSGAVCRPASMCSYTGEIKGVDVVVSNIDTVDDEGGSATNAMRLYFFSDTSGGGQVSSRYIHPGGFECAWSHYIELNRSK